MSAPELVLAVLAAGPRHGYELKRELDSWFPHARPIAFGQVYATLGRLVRSGDVSVVGKRAGAGPQSTVRELTDAGRARLQTWLHEPAPVVHSGAVDLVRRTVVALRCGAPAPELARRHRESLKSRQDVPQEDRRADGSGDSGKEVLGARLARRHAELHLQADLRWLEEVGRIDVEPDITSP